MTAAALLADAVESYSRGPRPLELALVAEDAGRAMGRLGRPDGARGVRGPRGRPQTGWPSLTVTERTVANLVAEGLSNPQIGERLCISRRTVQTHVARIFMKLGISSSRAQLVAEVIRQPERG
jgi:DNA-binding CsgD family transcriptional regulator